MAVFVIVHGGWGGGWEWREVARGLFSRGHEVHTPSLTGLGDRAHLARPDVGLATHVDDIVATLETYDLTDVVLVGQSYGGMVITAVVDRAPDRLSRLVYIDAFVPAHGQSCLDLSGPEWASRFRQLAREQGDGWRVPLPFTGDLGLPDAVAHWYVPRLVPQPLATFTDPCQLLHGAGQEVPRTFVRCLDVAGEEQDDPIAPSARLARESGWDYHEVVGPHDAHVSDPALLVRLLHELG